MVGEIGEVLKQEEYKGYTITLERTDEDIVVQLMNNDYEDMPWLYVTDDNYDFGKDVNAKSVPYPIDSDEEAEQAFPDSYILPFYSYTSPQGNGCQEVSAGNANGFLVYEKKRFHKMLNNDDPHGWLVRCLEYLDEVLNNERWSVVIYRPDGELTECWESFWGDEEEKQKAIEYCKSSIDSITKGSVNKKSRIIEEWGNTTVGAQKFTYQELEDAFNELEIKVYNDPDNLPEYVYDIRDGYSTTEYDIDTDWQMDFDFEQVVTELANIPDMITYGDLEVYFNYHPEGERYGYAESDDHGIFIEDGKITKVY